MMTNADERRGWCSSSISSTLWPSRVDKSTQPCPVLSSSIASTLLISTNTTSNSRTISTNATSSPSTLEERKKTTVVRSSLRHPSDYHSYKRIDDLHERMDDIQVASFLKFINHHLAPVRGACINDLSKDLTNGHALIDLIETLSSSSIKREHGHTRFHALSNVQIVLDYLKSRLQHVNISPHEIVSGNRKQTLALLWIIMKTFDFPGFRITSNKHLFLEYTLYGNGQDRSALLKWVNNLFQVANTNNTRVYAKDFFVQTWNDGSLISLLMKYLCPISPKYTSIRCLELIREIDQLNNDQRLESSFILARLCFDVSTTINWNDRSEKSLFGFFCELQRNVQAILKTNQIGKLSTAITNPFTKRLVDAVMNTTTTGHSRAIIEDEDDDDDYLICTKDDNLPPPSVHTRFAMNSSGHSTSSSESLMTADEMHTSSPPLRTVEKSRSFTGEQHQSILRRKNRWIESDTINGTSSQSEEKNDKDEEHEQVFVQLEQEKLPEEESKQLAVSKEEQSEQPSVSNEEEPEQLAVSKEEEPQSQTALDTNDAIQEQQQSEIELPCEEPPTPEILPLIEPVEDSLMNSKTQPNQSAVRARKPKKKKTTALIEKPGPLVPVRGMFVVLKECLHEPKMVAFKYVFFLACLCFSILIIVVHK